MPVGSRSKASKHVLCDPAIYTPSPDAQRKPRHVSDQLCIPDAITNALSDSMHTVYAPITTADHELSWVEEDGNGGNSPTNSRY
jgi:hypothetical protein